MLGPTVRQGHLRTDMQPRRSNSVLGAALCAHHCDDVNGADLNDVLEYTSGPKTERLLPWGHVSKQGPGQPQCPCRCPDWAEMQAFQSAHPLWVLSPPTAVTAWPQLMRRWLSFSPFFVLYPVEASCLPPHLAVLQMDCPRHENGHLRAACCVSPTVGHSPYPSSVNQAACWDARLANRPSWLSTPCFGHTIFSHFLTDWGKPPPFQSFSSPLHVCLADRH